MNSWRRLGAASRRIGFPVFTYRSSLAGSNSRVQPTICVATCCEPAIVQKRFISLRGLLGKSKRGDKNIEDGSKIKLAPDNLFHKLSKSPIPELRDRAAIINKYGVCPVCEAHEDKEQRKRPVYECPDCGYPTHCSEEHYNEGKEAHHHGLCQILREQNEDDHDLRSGRPMKEFEFPSKYISLPTHQVLLQSLIC